MSERRVWISVCLCPERHAILCLAGEADDFDEAKRISFKLSKAIMGNLVAGTMNPWCGICHAPQATWFIELGRTKYETMKEARPHLKEVERQQARVNALWADIPRSD